jgi:hypothetical protein
MNKDSRARKFLYIYIYINNICKYIVASKLNKKYYNIPIALFSFVM